MDSLKSILCDLPQNMHSLDQRTPLKAPDLESTALKQAHYPPIPIQPADLNWKHYIQTISAREIDAVFAPNVSIPREVTDEDIQMLKQRLQYLHTKVQNGWDSLDLDEIHYIYSDRSSDKCSSDNNTTPVTPNPITDPGEEKRPQAIVNMNPLAALGLLAQIILTKQMRVKEKPTPDLARVHYHFHRKVYPNLSEQTSGLWSTYTDLLDDQSKSEENYGRMGIPLVPVDKVRAIMIQYERESHMNQLVRRHNFETAARHQMVSSAYSNYENHVSKFFLYKKHSNDDVSSMGPQKMQKLDYQQTLVPGPAFTMPKGSVGAPTASPVSLPMFKLTVLKQNGQTLVESIPSPVTAFSNSPAIMNLSPTTHASI